MAHAERTVTIAAPIATVFGFLADGTNNPRWRPTVLDITPPEGGPAPGAVYKQGIKGPRDKRIDGDYRITTFDAPTALAFEVIAGPARPTGRFDLSDAGDGATSLRFQLNFVPKGVVKLMAGMVAKTMEAEVAYLDNVKTVLETG